MTPKEKAQELVYKINLKIPIITIPVKSSKAEQLSCDIDYKASIYNAKQCAIIAVDEILNVSVSYAGKDYEFWQQVKQEIEKL